RCNGLRRRDGLSRSGRTESIADRERHDQRAAGFQEIATSCVEDRHVGGVLDTGFAHGLLLYAMRSAARLTARTMRRCVPQRQRLPASAARVSSSLGFGRAFSNAAACMIMPLAQ